MKILDDYGIHLEMDFSKIRKVKSMAYEEATPGDVIKFEKPGDFVEGIYIGYEESRQFPGSFALKYAVSQNVKVVFVSGIVIDLIRTNSIEKGDKIKVLFEGKKKNKAGTHEYNDYKVFFERRE